MARILTQHLAGVLFTMGVAAWAGAVEAAPGDAGIPVAELDPHFKGGREGHAYTLAMLELGMRTGAATTAVLRNDPEQARVALKSLREQMTRVGAMVPTWKSYFGTGVLDELDRAVSAKADLATRRKLVGKLETSCTSCHAKYMFQVQAQYRWGSFADAVVGAGSGTLTFHEVMLDLASDLGAVRADVQAGQFTEATAVYKRLMERFGMMEQLCANCHDQPRQYFVDSAVKARLFKIGGLLRRGEKNVAEYTPLFKDVNEMSCLPCHQVHMPAAFVQRNALEGKK
jgi:cytochrome c556